jgi:polysaccharide pyruvyl transferase CsaB
MVLNGLDIGGAETHVVELSKELTRRGHEIIIASNGGVFEKEIGAAGIRHVQLPLHKRDARKMLAAYFGLKRLIQEGNFDLVHVHARIPAFICGLIRKTVKFRFITTAHWTFDTDKWLVKRLSNWGERTIAVSEDIKAYLMRDYRLPGRNITLTINGIDIKKFSPEVSPGDILTEFNLNADARRIVYVSRMDSDRSKVAFQLVEIAPRLEARYPGIEIVIVGGGNDYEKLLRAAEDRNKKAGKRIIIVAGVQTDINRFAAAADVFVGVSRAALEAMAAAKSVVVAGNEGYIGVFREDKLNIGIATNFCCRGCAESDSQTLYRDLAALLEQTPSERAEAGGFNRSVILNFYSEKRMADDCERAYGGLLSIDKKRPGDIVISGYYGYKNHGDDSLLSAIISNIREIKPDAAITVLSASPAETRRTYGVGSIHRFNIFQTARAMRRAKLLISGGGSLLQDVTSTKSLLYYLFIIKLAKTLGMRVMIYASGIGPICNRNNRAATGRTLNTVDCITLREPASYDELKALGADAPPVHVTADPAFALCKAEEGALEEIFQKEGIDRNRGYFIVSVRPWKKAGADFAQNLAALCDYITEKHGVTALFIPMQRGQDMAATEQITEKMKRECHVLRGVYSPQELIGIAEQARFVIGMRLHILIYAVTACVPVFGLSYDPKVDAMLAYLSQRYKENVEEASLSRMKKGIDEIMEKNDLLREDLGNRLRDMREKTRRDADFAVALLKK